MATWASSSSQVSSNPAGLGGSSAKSASPISPTSSTGNKRKRMSDVKFYAVRDGHTPGIYYSWKDCLQQVKGFKRATFKSFQSLADAESFIAGRDPSAMQKFYAVRNGRVPGVYTDWASAQKQITGWTMPKHRCFASRAEAEAFLKNGPDESETGHEMPAGEERRSSAHPDITQYMEPAQPAKKKSRSEARASSSTTQARSSDKTRPPLHMNGIISYEPGTGPLPLNAEDGFDPSLVIDPETGRLTFKTDEQMQRMVPKAIAPREDSVLHVYTDGSSLYNGSEAATAGVGVYFGPDDQRNLSEPLDGYRQTNQRAELTAMQRALDIAPRQQDVNILTDSSYSIKCVTEWYHKWLANGWTNASGKMIENRDLIEAILKTIQQRDSLGGKTDFTWLKGHADNAGNIAADHLAVSAARVALDLKARRQLLDELSSFSQG
ncbi:MAG: hypothetical protein M1817_005209 [Caeruleum heppii]|nr:MAG: hypothetical protein M1817_005209 [Caeruleum heppii]